jgi:hypothetical protein
MPIVDSRQKGFYDSLRQFQRKDLPGQPSPPATTPTGVPVGQLIAGVVVLALVVAGFLAFASPPPPPTEAAAPPAAPHAAAAAQR